MQNAPPVGDTAAASPPLADRRVLARAISRLERGEAQADQLIGQLGGKPGRAHIVGITGAPGAGKSTLVHALLGALLELGQRIAVVAVDPSSPLTGGAVLGDRVRMGEHGSHPDVFIRSVASRGHLGGLSAQTRGIVDLLDAAGFDTVIVETVGAGQSEVEILQVADSRIVACPPGLGDHIQSIKAGILEIADVLVVSKADLPGADPTARDLRDMLHLRAAGAPGAWQVPVLGVSAVDGKGLPELLAALDGHRSACGRGRRLQTDPQAGPAAALLSRLLARDPLAKNLGITLRDGGAGHATVALTIRADHLNFNGTCHGGVTFALADTAFGLASNSHGVIAAGIDAHITYQQAARAGETVLARAVEVSRSRKLAVYRVDLTRDGDGAVLCSFTGTVYVTSRPLEGGGENASD
ncbi:methylmalonyl Co-A mutase-associated GTPase MeaB [Piscinibacter sakaiensis]|uniref:methylmalonyl Co-A mutase-associated GTPase MeaB n=1 Tax=Piscinibacter sakaiensis TaxID=1547922 RepID=UPI003AB045E5